MSSAEFANPFDLRFRRNVRQEPDLKLASIGQFLHVAAAWVQVDNRMPFQRKPR